MTEEQEPDDHSFSQFYEVDKFLTDNMDEMLDIYYEFERRLTSNAHFLPWIRSTDITEFIMSSLFDEGGLDSSTLQFYNQKYYLYNAFLQEFGRELDSSFCIMDTFCRRAYIGTLIRYDDWAKFCMQFCILDDITTPRRYLM